MSVVKCVCHPVTKAVMNLRYTPVTPKFFYAGSNLRWGKIRYENKFANQQKYLAFNYLKSKIIFLVDLHALRTEHRL